jgi:serine/threonine protein kinase
LFWKLISKNYPANFFSEEFKDLITKMFKFSPEERLSLEQILSHPWMQGYMPKKD